MYSGPFILWNVSPELDAVDECTPLNASATTTNEKKK